MKQKYFSFVFPGSRQSKLLLNCGSLGKAKVDWNYFFKFISFDFQSLLFFRTPKEDVQGSLMDVLQVAKVDFVGSPYFLKSWNNEAHHTELWLFKVMFLSNLRFELIDGLFIGVDVPFVLSYFLSIGFGFRIYVWTSSEK